MRQAVLSGAFRNGMHKKGQQGAVGFIALLLVEVLFAVFILPVITDQVASASLNETTRRLINLTVNVFTGLVILATGIGAVWSAFKPVMRAGRR